MKGILLVSIPFIMVFSIMSVNALEINVISPLSNSFYEKGNSVPFELTTDIPAVCRYNIYNTGFPIIQYHFYDKDGNLIPTPIWMYAPKYSELANDFLTSNYLSFTASIENPDKGYYEYFVTCQDKNNSSNEAYGYLSFSIVEPLNITINSPIENNIYSKEVPISLTTNKLAKCNYQLSYSSEPSGNGSIGIGFTGYTNYYPITTTFSKEHTTTINMEGYNYIGFKCVDEENNTKISERIHLNITSQSNAPICSNGQTKCDGQTYYICSGNNWQYQGLINGQCGYSITNSQTNSHSSSSSSKSNSYNTLAYASADDKESQMEDKKAISPISLSNSEKNSTIQSLFPFMLMLFIVIIAVSLLVIKKRR